MITDLPARLFKAIVEAESDATDARHRLQCRVALSIGVERGKTVTAMAAGRIWDPLMAEARFVIGDDTDHDPYAQILRYHQTHRAIAEEYWWASQKLVEVQAVADAPVHHVVREQAVVDALAKVLQVLADAYGIEETT